MPGLVWAPLTEADLPGLRRLAQACLRDVAGRPHRRGGARGLARALYERHRAHYTSHEHAAVVRIQQV
ncbi:hypothetical protein P0Y31_10110 [Knoellia sp. 3-2P3]|uniref:hypothetical protein n=1 Tax=unclassified Knoellia TaxID=2618719 RepID=UPI0023DBB925|nr:hypothetical protein [Knoellia sp. 3-2P3]MDF2092697.1 hypothetical protein [Knoellia sp. 3-2P3]